MALSDEDHDPRTVNKVTINGQFIKDQAKDGFVTFVSPVAAVLKAVAAGTAPTTFRRKSKSSSTGG